MKIVFMGTPDFAAGILRALCEEGYEVAACVTQPDKPKGRKKEIVPGPTASEALKRNIPLLQPLKMKDPEFLGRLNEIHPDLIVVAAFGRIIPKVILDLPAYGCVNVHASLLPAWRGASPIQHMILNGDRVGGVTIMRMDEGLDTGDIISVKEVPLSDDETGGSLFDRLMEEGSRLLCETIPHIEDGTAVYTAQPEESTTPYAAMITKESGHMDWTKSAVELERMVRAYDPWPGAWTVSDGKRIRIWKTTVAENPSRSADDMKPGQIVSLSDSGIEVYCGDGVLIITELQAEGKKRMKAADYLRGLRTKPDSFEL